MKIFKHILTTIFGIATLSTFFMPAERADDVWFNVLRVAVMLIFLGLLLSYKPNHQLAESIKKAPRSARVLMIVIPIVVLVFVLIQTFWPEFAVWLVRCDSQAKCGFNFRHAIFIKAALQLVAVAFFAILAYNFAKKKQILPAVFACLVILILVAMAGEELSWGQRIFGWSTPESWAAINAQSETNLHNLATQLFQNTLYFGGWLLLVVLPFWRTCIKKFLGKFKKFAFLGDWLPPTYFLLIFAAAFGLVDAITAGTGIKFSSILFSIIATAAILVYLIVPARGVLAERICLVLGVFMFALFFNLFVSEVWNLNAGAPTEYLELFISFGIMWWAIDLKNRLLPVRQRHH
ncbi:MAG: hypothetical protein LBQ11_00955 [Candidatus Nomurabacteria bacterium]|jgi:hypothetical protein|nr:hypothetical protein [Candidatus Nomurabacteria bacterium]